MTEVDLTKESHYLPCEIVSSGIIKASNIAKTKTVYFGKEYLEWLDSKPKNFLSFHEWMFTYHPEVHK